MADIKSDERLADIALVKQSRLSVMPISDAHWKIILKSGVKPSQDLITLTEIEDGEAKRVMAQQEVVVVRQGENAVAYINICPHLGTPLQMDDDDFITDDGAHLAA